MAGEPLNADRTLEDADGSLRGINEITLSAADLSLSGFALAHPPAPATSLRAINDFAGVPALSLSDFALAHPSAPVTSLRAINALALLPVTSLRVINDLSLQGKGSAMMAEAAAFYFGAR